VLNTVPPPERVNPTQQSTRDGPQFCKLQAEGKKPKLRGTDKGSEFVFLGKTKSQKPAWALGQIIFGRRRVFVIRMSQQREPGRPGGEQMGPSPKKASAWGSGRDLGRLAASRRGGETRRQCERVKVQAAGGRKSKQRDGFNAARGLKLLNSTERKEGGVRAPPKGEQKAIPSRGAQISDGITKCR